ncbi:MAG: hypothetical protein A2Y58_03240 [Chloroflexi bacterium RBG_13_51_52]|nr:MAG: hypothetical protein A2Y58_03240 [Chloroflexi bacterium RBG_13_51_52]
MKSIIIAFAAILLTIALPFVYQSIDDALTEDYEQSFAGVSTSAGAFASNVTLGRSIYRDDSAAVSEITSNISSDTPSAASYNSVSRALEVGGLEESAARTLVINYAIDNPGLEDAMATFLTLLRWFYLFILIGTAGGAIYAFFD